MRRIKSQEQIQREKDRNVKIMSAFMLVVLVFGTLGFAFSGSFNSDSIGSGGNDNSGEDNQGFVQPIIRYQGQNIPITLDKGTVQDISVDITKDIDDFSGEILYLDIKDESFFASEIQRSVGLFATDVRGACYGACEIDLPERTCDQEGNLIVFTSSEEDSVREENNCIFIEGDLKAVDAFIYHVFGQ